MKQLPTGAYGMLLAVDSYGVAPETCGPGRVKDFLNVLPDKIGMRKLSEPFTTYVSEAGIKGTSGFVFIYESHISIHTYEEIGFVTIDIYSCKWFDSYKVLEQLSSWFGPQSVDSKVIVRGKRFQSSSM